MVSEDFKTRHNLSYFLLSRYRHTVIPWLLILCYFSIFTLRELHPLGKTSETQKVKELSVRAAGSLCWSGDERLCPPHSPHCPAIPKPWGPDCGNAHCEVAHKAAEFPWWLLFHTGWWLSSESPCSEGIGTRDARTIKRKRRTKTMTLLFHILGLWEVGDDISHNKLS